MSERDKEGWGFMAVWALWHGHEERAAEFNGIAETEQKNLP